MRFEPGATVRTYAGDIDGHYRLPAYLRGQVGRVERYCGRFPFPGTRATGATAEMQALYTVRFARRDIFADGADGAIFADLFESYLEEER